MSDNFKEFMKQITPEAELKMMEGSFAFKGSKPYYILGTIAGMTIGFKFICCMGPVVAAGVRLRIQWAAGNSDLDTACEKFKRPLLKGSTPTNASYAFWLPLIHIPTHVGLIRDVWASVGGADKLMSSVFDYCEEIGIKPAVTKDQALLYIGSEFDSDFPHLVHKPVESATVIPMEEFAMMCHTLLEEHVKKNHK